MKSEGGPWGEGLWCGPEKLPTLQGTGGWGAGSVAGLEKQGPRKTGRVVRAWKSVAGELVVPGKAWAWRSNSTVEPGKAEVRREKADNNWRHDEGWRLSTRDWRQGGGKKAGAGDSGQRKEEQETAAAQWQRSLIFLRSLRTVESGAAEIF